MRPVVLLSCDSLPEPDLDEAPLLKVLAAKGVDANVQAWDNPAYKPEAGSLVIIRSTWNYYYQLESFLSWLHAASKVATVLNSASIVEWNADKRYLGALRAAGVPSVETVYVTSEQSVNVRELLSSKGWSGLVIKPCVSAGSWQTQRFSSTAWSQAQAFLEQMGTRCAMIQPYMERVESTGERAVVMIDGVLTHAVRKSPRFGGDEESVSEALPIAPEQREVAEAALRWAGADGLLYGRVDLMPAGESDWQVSEIELIEPSLFLVQSEHALDRFATTIARLARERSSSGGPSTPGGQA